MIYVWCVIKIFLVNPLLWLFKHRIVLVVLIAGGIGLFAYQSCNNASGPESEPDEKNAPTVQDAGYILQTYSRRYYLVKFDAKPSVANPDVVTLFRWYEWDGKVWQLEKSTEGVPFDRKVQGEFKLDKR